MIHIIDGKKFDEANGEVLARGGLETAMHSSDGEIVIYRSPKGTLWGTLKYWSNQFGPQNISAFTGDEVVHDFLLRHNFLSAAEKIFGVIEEG